MDGRQTALHSSDRRQHVEQLLLVIRRRTRGYHGKLSGSVHEADAAEQSALLQLPERPVHLVEDAVDARPFLSQREMLSQSLSARGGHAVQHAKHFAQAAGAFHRSDPEARNAKPDSFVADGSSCRYGNIGGDFILWRDFVSGARRISFWEELSYWLSSVDVSERRALS